MSWINEEPEYRLLEQWNCAGCGKQYVGIGNFVDDAIFCNECAEKILAGWM